MDKTTEVPEADDEFVALMRSHLLELQPAEERVRIRRIGSETLQAFEQLAPVRRAVSVFGSAQPDLARRWGPPARETAALLAHAGFAVITGWRPGPDGGRE